VDAAGRGRHRTPARPLQSIAAHGALKPVEAGLDAPASLLHAGNVTTTAGLHAFAFERRRDGARHLVSLAGVDFAGSRSSMGNHSHQEDAMKYLILIHQGDAPTPYTPDEWAKLSEDEQNAVYRDYQAINQDPRVTPGVQMEPPETATTVRVQDGRTLTTDGPFAEVKEAIGGYFVLEAEDLDAAIEVAARVPAARLGGAVEVRPVVER